MPNETSDLQGITAYLYICGVNELQLFLPSVFNYLNN